MRLNNAENTMATATSPKKVSIDLCEGVPSYIAAIAPYQPGKPISELERELGIQNAIKLASNENPLGASPFAINAAKSALNDVARYPDGNGFALKHAIAEHYRLEMEQIVLGNGSNDILELVARTFLSPGTSAVYAQHAFAVYPLVVQATGAQGIEVPAKDYGHDLDMMAAAIKDDTRVVFIANPNNPTGTLASADALYKFLSSVPERTMVVLDEAYNEYIPELQRVNGVAWLKEFPNLLVTRTFSKAYGLAGLRVGYGLAHSQVIDLLNRVRQPFNVSSVAQAAAIAALRDQEFVHKSFLLNMTGMLQITKGLQKLGIEYIPSYGNFISFRIDDALQIYNKLLKLGVIVRPIASYGLPNFLRVSIGLAPENEQFLRTLEIIKGDSL